MTRPTPARRPGAPFASRLALAVALVAAGGGGVRHGALVAPGPPGYAVAVAERAHRANPPPPTERGGRA